MEELKYVRLRGLYKKRETEMSVLSENDPAVAEAVIKPGIVHFYFCAEGAAEFKFAPHYSRHLNAQTNYFFFQPEGTLKFTIETHVPTKIVALDIPLAELHHLFVDENLPIFEKNGSQKYYEERAVPSSVMIVLNQILQTQLPDGAAKLYYQGKTYELLSLYFARAKSDAEVCPFVQSEETLRKLKFAREYLLKNILDPPNMKDLAKLSGLNDFQLKTGFKEYYGSTVYGYLIDHRLELGRHLLDSGNMQVNEVATEIGYGNTSHFIAAFKKKFSMTPKKYLMSKE